MLAIIILLSNWRRYLLPELKLWCCSKWLWAIGRRTNRHTKKKSPYLATINSLKLDTITLSWNVALCDIIQIHAKYLLYPKKTCAARKNSMQVEKNHFVVQDIKRLNNLFCSFLSNQVHGADSACISDKEDSCARSILCLIKVSLALVNYLLQTCPFLESYCYYYPPQELS